MSRYSLAIHAVAAFSLTALAVNLSAQSTTPAETEETITLRPLLGNGREIEWLPRYLGYHVHPHEHLADRYTPDRRYRYQGILAGHRRHLL